MVTKLAYEEDVKPRRSFIFAPALKPDMFYKALRCGADIVCVELEDGVAPKDKDLARDNAIEIFSGLKADEFASVEKVLRINTLRSEAGLNDVRAVLESKVSPPVLMLPKVVSPDEVSWLDELLSERGYDTRLHIIIETNEGLENAYEIAKSSSRIEALFFGGFDMAAELRCKMAWEPLLYARSRVAHAASGAGVDAIDVPFLDLQDLGTMKREAELARDLGYCGKGAIHPNQIPFLNEVFTPSAEKILHARKIVDAFEEAETGLLVIEGKLIEKPVIREMKRLLTIADRITD
jgi:(S)-citramalyl-CoA lyase